MSEDPYGRYGVPGVTEDPQNFGVPGVTEDPYSAYGEVRPGPFGSPSEPGPSSSSSMPQYSSPTWTQPGDSSSPPAPAPGNPPGAYGPSTGAYLAPAVTSGKAIASLIIGILALVSCGWLTIASPVGLVLGILGLKEADRGERSGRGLAIAGIITSAVGMVLIVLGILYVAFMIVLAVASSS